MRNLPRFLSFLLLGLLLSSHAVRAQRVGLVLSGGGAKGLAHVGVLKVLEKNRIPIDYIVGTSMGAIVGGMYAAGYSPQEIEDIVLRSEFQDWVANRPLEGKVYNFYDSDPSPAALHLGLAIDSSFRTRVTPRIINDATLNYVLATMLAPAGAIANYNFDNLFVPYRAVASEVFTRQKVVQRSGSLSDAVRNSMAFPLAFRPIRQPDGRYLFDGAVVDNFPTGVMREEFKPDVIIGVNVGDVAFRRYPKEKDDQLLTSTLFFLGSNAADTLSVGPNGVFIQPDVNDYTAADFGAVRRLVAVGEKAAQNKLDETLKRVTRRVDTVALQQRRRAFQESAPRPDFSRVTVQGLPGEQQNFVRSFFLRSGSKYAPSDIEEGYFRLVSNDFFTNVYPRIRYNAEQKGYQFNIDARQANNLTADLGVLLSSRSMSNIYIGGAYRYLYRYLYTVEANATVGRFYNAVQGSFRISIPGAVPLFIKPIVTFNNLNYQDTGGLLGANAARTQLTQRDLKTGIQIGVSPNYRSRYVLDAGLFTNRDLFANTNEVSSDDELDLNRFQGATAAIRFERNSLNRNQYPTKGRHFEGGLRAIVGQEKYEAGTTAGGLPDETDNHRWLKASLQLEQYFSLTKSDSVGARVNSWGYLFDAVVSTQGRFATYRSSLTTSPAFLPLPDSRTLFLDRYRGTSYAAAGLRYARGVFRSIEWRTEVFMHVLVRPWEQRPDNPVRPQRGPSLSRPYFTAMTGLVYQTPVGPFSVQAIHYDERGHRFGVFAHIGYVLFRDRSLD